MVRQYLRVVKFTQVDPAFAQPAQRGFTLAVFQPWFRHFALRIDCQKCTLVNASVHRQVLRDE